MLRRAALAVLGLLAFAGSSLAAPGGLPVRGAPDPVAHLRRLVVEALAARFRVPPGALTLEAPDVGIEEEAGERRVVIPAGVVRVSPTLAWGLQVGGEVGFRLLRLELTWLELGRIALRGVPSIVPRLVVQAGDLSTFLQSKGVIDPRIGSGGEPGSLEISGIWRFRFLLFRMSPRVTVRGGLSIDDGRVRFVPGEVAVERAPPLVRGLIRKAAARESRKALFGDLVLEGVAVEAARIVVEDRGTVVFAQELGSGR